MIEFLKIWRSYSISYLVTQYCICTFVLCTTWHKKFGHDYVVIKNLSSYYSFIPVLVHVGREKTVKYIVWSLTEYDFGLFVNNNVFL